MTNKPKDQPMKKYLLILAVALLALTVGASQTVAAPAAVAAKKCKKKKAKKKCKKKQQQTGPQGPTGPQGTGTSGAPGAPAAVKATLAQVPDFTTAAGGPLFIHNQGNTTVTQTADGIAFGPYGDGGTAGGSVEYTGLNGQPLSAVQSLVYLARYTADNDTGGVGVPYLRIFLEDDGHDAIFSPNTQPPNPDVSQGPFHTWVATSGVWRYDDDGGSGGPGTYGVNGAPFSTLQDDHGTETISGIYVSVGNSAGTNLAALLREWGVNGTTYSFSS
jgi:hypothetical protein